MDRVLVTGGAGQLAEALRRTWTRFELVIPEETELDLGSPEAITRVVTEVRPLAVVNAGAFTAVDRCEAEPERAMRINGEAVGWLAQACAANQVRLVQISTDYVFDGTATRPYREGDRTNPRSVYGRTKLRGEQEAAKAPDHLIVRTAWLYDAWGKNFLRTMLNAAAQGRSLRVVDDQRGCPTSCRALARQLEVALLEGWRGLVHGTCAGETTWHGFAAEIFRQAGIAADLSPCTTADHPLPAPRPAYSVLDGTHRSALGTDVMPDWRMALDEVMPEIEPKKDS